MTAIGTFAIFALLWLTVPVNAGCTCQCVSGRMQPLCDGAIDLPPICPPTICPLAGPELAPLPSMQLPPLGTSSCQQARVCDQFGNCRWQEVCR
jgi:hypothetical protein